MSKVREKKKKIKKRINNFISNFPTFQKKSM